MPYHVCFALHSFTPRGPRFTRTRGEFCGGSAVGKPFKGRTSYASATECATGTATRAVSVEGIATADRGFILSSTAPMMPAPTTTTAQISPMSSLSVLREWCPSSSPRGPPAFMVSCTLPEKDDQRAHKEREGRTQRWSRRPSQHHPPSPSSGL